MIATRFFALGGMQEIGKTTLVFEHDDEIIVVDAGIKFVSTAETGVEGLIPDYEYLTKNQHKIVALFITHGHEDHIGGIPYLLQFTSLHTIYAPLAAIELIQDRLKEFKITKKLTFKPITDAEVIRSKHFTIDFYTTQHSIPDSYGIRVKTINGTIVDTGDFRFDYTPIGNLTDFKRMEQIAKEGVDILISDSTNALSPQHSPTEQMIIANIESFLVSAEGKVVFTTFASNLNRVKIITDLAIKHNRKIFPVGRSMTKAISIWSRLKYLQIPPQMLVDKKDLGKHQDKELVIISTGSQGEENAALSKMSIGKHPQVTLKNKDIVIFSSSAIPGNKVKIELLINSLYKLGVEVKENRVDGLIHTSGHAYKDEHVKTFQIFKPKYFIPYHGAYRQSAVHGYTAVENGVNKNNVFVIANGEVVEMLNHTVRVTSEKIDYGPIYIDSNMAIKDNSEVIKMREWLGVNGFINVVVIINKLKNEIVGRTRIVSRGAIYVKKSNEIMNEVQRLAHGAILHTIKNKKE